MENKNDNIEFDISYEYKHQIDIWRKGYNINHQKIELFYDFLISLYDLIDNTFLGEDILNNETDQQNHFKWCWNKTIQNFAKERIYFNEKGIHYEHFWIFFFEAYYINKMGGKNINVNDYITHLFDFYHIKTTKELAILSEIYRLLEQNLKK